MTPASDGSALHGGTPASPTGEARMCTLLDHLSLAVFEADESGRIRLANAGWERLTGRAPADIVGQPLDTFAHPEDRAVVAARVSDLRAGIRPSARCEFRLAAADRTRWVELLVHAVHDAAGHAVHFVGSLADTTLRRDMEHELRQLAYAEQEARADAESAAWLLRAEAGELERERADAVAAARSNLEFIASMAHDLRTPLNGILAFSEWLLRSELNAEQREHAATVRASAEALDTLVSDLVELSRGDAGEDTGQVREFSPRDAMADVARLLAQKAMAKGLTFSAYISPTVPARVRGAEAHVRQIITNLASNALRFSEEGSVSVLLSRAPGQRDDDRVPLRIEVHDTDRSNSSGMLAETLLAGGTGAAGGGLRGSAGLGLAISRRLVERMGGTLRAGSEPGVGCVIEVDLPLERAAAVPEPATSAPAPAPPLAEAGRAQLDLSVLVAEDHPVNQKVALRTLQQWGVRPDVVADGRAAVEAVARAHYDVVLMDVTMPGMNGLDATAAIRAAERTSGVHTVILAMTAHTSPGARESCLAAGMDGYVSKPLREEDLYAELRRWAGRGDTERRAA